MTENTQLQKKLTQLQQTIQDLKKEVKALKQEKTSQKKEYTKEDLETFKLFNYYIKSISSIYIYILLGEEYEQLYKEIEKLLHVDPFEQHKNFTQFEKVLQRYPDITKKRTIHDIFLYKNQQIQYQIQSCIKNELLTEFENFLQSKNCTLLDFYLLTTGYDEDEDEDEDERMMRMMSIFNILYLDHFKDQDILDDYKSTKDIFIDILYHEFPNLMDKNEYIFTPFQTNLDNNLQMSKKRTRNYRYIIATELFPPDVLDKITKEFIDPCK